ncbi:MAG: SdrD B-like domain-containing protein, partial [Bacillota bacterium]
WMGQSSVGRAYDVYARRYAVNAEPQGNEFIANTVLASAQQNPAVAMNASGAFVVVWESAAQDDPDGKAGIYAQRYDALGQKLDIEMLVNTHTSDDQRNPAVAMADEGTFTVAWNSLGQDGSEEGVYVQRFDAAGQRLAGEFRVNNRIEQSQSNPAIAMDARASFVVTWQSDGQDGSGEGVYARRYLRNTQGSSVGDFVWDDADADGMQDAGESGVDGVTVRLLDQAGRMVDTTTTVSGGWYDFRDLSSGTYVLEFVVPAGFILAAAHRGGDETLDSDADSATGRTPAFVLGPNQADMDCDAGLIAWPSINGSVFNDRNGDGKHDTSEVGLVGWIVYLDTNRNGRLDTDEISTTTGPDGRYALMGLAPGAYCVALLPQMLWRQTSPASLSYEVTLRMGQRALEIDFGNQTAIPNSTARGGSLLTVNTTPCLEFHTPRVAMDAAGDFAIAWSGNRAADGWRVLLQRYGSTVRKRGSETIAMEAPWNDLAMDAAGNFAIAGVFASSIGLQWYSAEGVLQREIACINDTACDAHEAPALAMDADGDLVVAWKGTSSTGTGSGIHLQRYSAAGVHQGSDLYLPGAVHPALAMGADGGFVLAWESQSLDETGQSHLDIRARRYNASGAPQGPAFRVNATLAGEQRDPAVAMDAAGGFVIAWDSNAASGVGADGNGWGIYARRYNAGGEPQGGESRINTSTAGDQRYPAVALHNGDLVIAWAGAGADGIGIYAQRYNAAGVAQGGELFVGDCPVREQISPDVAIDAKGNFVVAWQSETGINARRYSVNHAPTTRGIPDVLVGPSASDTVINLFAAFADDKDEDNKLTYTVVNNSNPSLFDLTRIDSTTGQLILGYAPGAMGSAELTLRATDTGGLWVETTFTVTMGR